MRASAAASIVMLWASASAQQVRELAATADLLRERLTRPAALHDLVQAGADGARATMAAFERAARASDAHAEIFARALADLGGTTAAVVDALLDTVPRHDEPLRSHLLRALANSALFATADQRARILDSARRWAGEGLLYSPAEDRPTFAWYEYVRIVRRLQVADAGRDGAALRGSMLSLRNERAMGVAWLRAEGQQPVGKDPHCAIESFGAHGQRELLEAIGELALTCPDELDDELDDVLAELTSYLRRSPPREPRIQTEHCAGIGENAPNALPGVKWPTLWRYDEWHFACAQAVLARHSDVEARQLALRHLLYASDIAIRLRAFEAVRQWPQPRTPFAEDLARCLHDDNRIVVREAIVTIMQSSPATLARARAELQDLAGGADRELAALARRALR